MGEITPPGDKSISHRAVIFASQSKGKSRVRNLLISEDTMRTVEVMREMGVEIKGEKGDLIVEGVGMDGLKEPERTLYCGNSGTTIRLMLGVLASRDFFSVLTGDESLTKRPMGRVTSPLKKMGANILGRKNAGYLPLAINGGGLKGICYDMPVSSAQVKSALILAGMKAGGATRISDPGRSRDHTERMMEWLGIPVSEDKGYIVVNPVSEFDARDIEIAGDISAAAFFIVGVLITPGSELMLRGVSVNPGRTGLINALTSMGANIDISNRRDISGEPVADLLVVSSDLKGITVKGDSITDMIDEIPILAVAAAFSDGETIIKDAGELRVKESDRIKTTVVNLMRMGVVVEELKDGMVISGRAEYGYLNGGRVNSFGDHRVAMSAAIAGLASKNGVTITDIDCVNTSFPEFFSLLDKVAVR